MPRSLTEPRSERRPGSMHLLVPALALVLTGGGLALLLSRTPLLGTVCAVACIVGGCAAGLLPVADVLGNGVASSLRLDWDGPHGPLVVELDSLSAFFLLPTLSLSALASVYGGAYLYEYRDRKPLGLVWFLFSLFVAGMMLV